MATADAKRRLRKQPVGATILLTIVGYALVLGTFLLDVPIYPDLTNAQVNLLSHVIAVINTTATVVLLLGWYWIRAGDVEKHRLAMVSGFVLILGFLVVYLLKVGGGGTKEFVGPDLATTRISSCWRSISSSRSSRSRSSSMPDPRAESHARGTP